MGSSELDVLQVRVFAVGNVLVADYLDLQGTVISLLFGGGRGHGLFRRRRRIRIGVGYDKS